jgi:glycosyltransferase involved in cell wall biosynthesis
VTTIGVHVREDAAALEATLASLRRASPGVSVVILPDAPDAALAQALAGLERYPQRGGDARGGAAALNRLAAFDSAPVIVLLESGSIVTPGWLERLEEALEADPQAGLAGPSTNLAWNAQRVADAPEARSSQERIDAFARALGERCGDRRTSAAPRHSLSDFCYAVKRTVVEAIGAADEAFGEGPCWEMEYTARAAASGFANVWVQGCYVHRLPIGARRKEDEARRSSQARARYRQRLQELEGPKGPPALVPPATAPAGVAPVVVVSGSNALVSCIMPTRDRRPFVGRAVAQFLAQDYPHRELIVVDDGADPIADLLPADPRIRLIRPLHRLTIGAKRNLACEAAAGALVAHWDDDDWMAEWRLRYQVESLLRSGADLCGLSRLYFHEPASGRAWEYAYPDGARGWLAGGSLCYRTEFWRAHRFPDVNEGEDTRFVWGARGAKLMALDDPSFYVATVHPCNTSRKRTSERRYRPCPPEVVDRIMRRATPPLVSCIMPTRDRRDFVPFAIDYFLGQDYPNRELVVVDDGRDRVGDLMPDDPRVRYLPVSPRSLGEKRNAAVAAAAGEYVAHWDDDDWYGTHRLSAEIEPLARGLADVSALSMRHVLSLAPMQYWRCEPALHARLHHRDLCCGTIVYPRRLWEQHGPYPALNLGEDVRFVHRAASRGACLRRLDDESLFVCVRHDRNTWRIAQDWTTGRPGWTAVGRPEFVGTPDHDRYATLAGAVKRRGSAVA